MSVATALNSLSARIQTAYNALEAKGATMPEKKDTWHLSATIESIPTGDGGLKYMLDPTLSAHPGSVYNEDAQGLRNYAFSYNQGSISSIVLPNVKATFSNLGVSSLTSNWFSVFGQKQPNLEVLEMPQLSNTSNIGSIYRNYLDYWPKLKKLVIPKVTGKYSGTTTESDPRVWKLSTLEHVEWGVSQIGDYDFYNTTSLKTLRLENCANVTSNTALQGCSSLTSLVIGAPLQSNASNYSNLSVLTALTDLTIQRVYKVSYDYANYADNVFDAAMQTVVNLTLNNKYFSGGYSGLPAFGKISAPRLKHVKLQGASLFDMASCPSVEYIECYPPEDYPYQDYDRDYIYPDYIDNLTQLKQININVITYGLLEVQTPIDGNWECHIWLNKNTNIENRLWYNVRKYIPHGFVLHFPLRGTKIVYDETTSDWIEIQDTNT